jgi:MoxR-like ATPase
MSIAEVETRRIDAKYLVPRKDENYQDVGLVALLESLSFGPNLILKGQKGVGKTLAVEQWASQHEIPLLRQDCTEETSVRDLVGTFSLQGKQVFYMLGALTAAIDIANEQGGCVLVLEEINTLPPQAQKILNPIADYRQEISIPKIGRVFRVNGGARIWIVGTMNPNYGGTYNLNEDFRSRFEFVEVNYMSTALERELLLKQFPTTPNARERQLVDRILNLSKETRSGEMEYALSTRDLVQFVKNFIRLNGLERALKLLEGKFEGGDHVKNFRARVQSSFQVNLDQVTLIE